MVDPEPNRKVERPKKAVKSGNDKTGLGSDFKIRRRTGNWLFGILEISVACLQNYLNIGKITRKMVK